MGEKNNSELLRRVPETQRFPNETGRAYLSRMGFIPFTSSHYVRREIIEKRHMVKRSIYHHPNGTGKDFRIIFQGYEYDSQKVDVLTNSKAYNGVLESLDYKITPFMSLEEAISLYDKMEYACLSH